MARRKDRPAPPSGPKGAPEWVVTFTDMISLLVTFFVLLMTFSSLDENDLMKVESILSGKGGIHEESGFVAISLQDDLIAATDVRRGALSPHSRPLEELPENIEAMGQQKTSRHLELDLEEVADGLVLDFGEEASFLPGSAEVPPELATSLAEIGRVLEHYPHLVVVEGFTDGQFVPTPTYATSDELAFARAAAAARVLVGGSELPEQLVQVASEGDRRPRASDDTATGRQLNRRVQLRILSLSKVRADHVRELREAR